MSGEDHYLMRFRSRAKPFRRGWFIVAIFLLTRLHAQVSDIDGRAETDFISPIIAEEVLPTPPQEFEVRFGTDYRQKGSEATGALPYVEANFGVFDRLGGSLNILAAYNNQNEPAYGFGDVSLTLKYLAVSHTQKMPAVVVGLETQFPTGDKHLGLDTGTYELTPFVGFLKAVGPIVVQGEIGWLKQVTGKHESACSYEWSAAAPIYDHKFYGLAEIIGQAGQSNEATFAPGVKYFFSKRLSAGIAAPIGLTSSAKTWGVFTQFEVQF